MNYKEQTGADLDFCEGGGGGGGGGLSLRE